MRQYEHGGDIYSNENILLDYSVNTNPLGMPNAVRHAIVDNIDAFERYPDQKCRELRAVLSRKHNIDADMILCGNGASDLIFRICAALKPKHALLCAPTFSEYARGVRLFGGETYEYALKASNGFLLDTKIIHSLDEKTDMLFLCTPNNPTGRLIDMKTLCAIVEECLKRKIIIVLDECFIEFTDGESMIAQLDAFPNIIILHAFTKLYSMAGIRLGYIAAAKTLAEKIEPFGAEWSVSGVAQSAGIAALGEVDWAEKTRRLIDYERNRIVREIAALGIMVYESDANFLLLRCENEICEPLLRRGILVRNCKNFSGLDERFVRIGIKDAQRNDVLLRALKEVVNG